MHEKNPVKLVITGGSGFIGSVGIRHSNNSNDDAINLEIVAEVGDNERNIFEQLDIRSYPDLDRALAQCERNSIVDVAVESYLTPSRIYRIQHSTEPMPCWKPKRRPIFNHICLIQQFGQPPIGSASQQ